MVEHTVKSFDNDISQLRGLIAEMGGLAEVAIRDAVDALSSYDEEKARQVVANDPQIDALEAMGLNSIGYLIVPRVIAGVVMFPVLYISACFVGITGGVAVGHWTGAVPAGEFISGAREFFHAFDAVFGIIKSLVFGFAITSISCYKGYYTSGGAEGVGRSTTEAAVTSCVYLLLADLLLASTLL